MKRTYIQSLFFAFLLLFAGYGVASAQVMMEFGLNLRMQSGNFHDTITFGYDPMARDGCDKNLGEFSDYPPLGFNDFVMVNNDTSFHDSFTKVDYRHKPTANAFEIDYKWSARSENFPFTISWTPANIPAIIKHIYLVPAPAQSVILADLTKQSSVTISADSMLYYQDCILKLLYNEETNAVMDKPQTSEELLSGLSIFPNPSHQPATLAFDLSRPAQLSIQAYDVNGRLVLNESRTGALGHEQISITPSTGSHGPLFLRVTATAASRRTVRTITLVRQ